MCAFLRGLWQCPDGRLPGSGLVLQVTPSGRGFKALMHINEIGYAIPRHYLPLQLVKMTDTRESITFPQLLWRAVMSVT